MFLRGDMKLCIACLVFFSSFHSVAGTLLAQQPSDVIANQSSAQAEQNSIVLTIEGKIAHSPVQFTLERLMQLPSQSIVRTNHWTKEKEAFTGVLLKDLLESTGIDSSRKMVEVVAHDDYKVAIRIQDIYNYDYLLTYKKNNKLYSELPVKENNGPLAIMIDFDRFKELEFEIYKYHMVWFVKAVVVE